MLWPSRAKAAPAPLVSAVLLAHGEGLLAAVTLRNLLDCAQAARGQGLDVELLVVLDRPTPLTAAVFADVEAPSWRLVVTDFGDQGLARNAAAAQARGDYIAFLDGDDLWSANWLPAALSLCITQPGRIIAHPQFNWSFGQSEATMVMTDQESALFDPSFLIYANYWDAMHMAPREVLVAHPFASRDIANGFAYEDWQWNVETMAAGYVHRVAADTIHFKRARPGSQSGQSGARRALVRSQALMRYGSDASGD